MKQLKLLLGLLLFLICSCAEEMQQQKTSETRRLDNHISMADAKKRLPILVADMQCEGLNDLNRPTSKSAIVIKETALDKQMRPLTRAEEADASCYIFQMDNGQFAIMSATTTRPELLAVGYGTPDLTKMPSSNEWNVDYTPDTLPHVIGGKDRFIVYRRLDPIKKTRNAALCDVKWGNEEPYFDSLKVIPSANRKAAAGCTAVAIAQMMTTKKLRGGYYKDHHFDWDMLAQRRFARSFIDLESRIQVATLMKDINNKENLDAMFGVPVTEAWESNIPRVWQNFHFSESGTNYHVVPDTVATWGNYLTRTDFVNRVLSEFNNGYPVLMMARQPGVGGHAWVCHGALDVETPVLIYSVSIHAGEPDIYLGQYTEHAVYFQMNWGWDGIADGYYLIKWDGELDNTQGPDSKEIGFEDLPTRGGYNCYDSNSIHAIIGVRL